MSDKELKHQFEKMKRAAEKACKSKKSARAFLVKAGIATKGGQLTKAYR